MITALLIDDEKLSRNTLRQLLSIHCPMVEIVAECENAIIAEKQIEQLKPDLVFLDVAMPGKNGIDFLRDLTQINFEVIFVTAHDRYILQAIRLAAVDYLLKPVEEEQLIIAVENAVKRIEMKSTNKNVEIFLKNMSSKTKMEDMQVCIPTLKGFQVVQIDDIIYCEADNTYTSIYLKDNKKIMASRPLIDYDKLLDDVLFVRIHKSFLINMKHIKEYQKGEGGAVVMSNGTILEVSRRKKEFFIGKMKEVFKF